MCYSSDSLTPTVQVSFQPALSTLFAHQSSTKYAEKETEKLRLWEHHFSEYGRYFVMLNCQNCKPLKKVMLVLAMLCKMTVNKNIPVVTYIYLKQFISP